MPYSTRRLARSAWVVGAFAIVAPAVADAGEAPATNPPEAVAPGDIVVTAERRETGLLKTPIAVSAIGADTLRSRRIETLADLNGKLPGINLPNGYANMQSIYIRGIGTADPGVPAAVGIYVDDVYIPRTFGNALFDLPDIERVEVLRGPQGTLYGQNTSAGAVKLVSRKPSDTLTGLLYAEGGNYNAFRGSLYLSGPVVPGLLDASVAYTHRQRDGYTYDVTTGRHLDALNTDQARAQLRFTPSDAIEATLSVDREWDDSDNLIGVPLNYGTPDPRRTYANTDPRLNRDSGGAGLHVSARVADWLTLKSITGYRAVKDHPSPWDWDGTPIDTFGWSQSLRSRQWSQEVQALGDIGRLSYTIGAIYSHEKFDFDRFSWRSQKYSEIESHLKDENWGLYGQVNYQLTDRLKITGGLRYGGETQRFSNLSYNNLSDGTRTSLIYAVDGLKDSRHKLTPKAAIDFQWSSFVMSYASVTRGSKSGGFNRVAGTAQIAAIPVAPETVTAYEIGTKGRTANGVFQGSVAAFYNDFKDYQASITNPTIDGVLINGQVIVNAAAAKTYGVEAEATLAPVRGLRWHTSATWLHTRFGHFANPTGAAASDFTGHQLPFAPRWAIGTDIDYTLPLAIPGDLALNASLDYRAHTWLDAANLKATELNPQVFVDAGATYRLPGDRWTLQLQVRNLFDKTMIIGPHFLTPAIGVDVVGYSQPRTVTGSVRYSF